MKVSVIIPVYNQEKLLRKAVNSLPLDEDIEVIIIDDGSTDKSWEVAQELSEHPKIRCFHLEKNCGVSVARNMGIDMAWGDYLFMLDSDDYVYEDNFLQVMSMLDGTDLVFYNLKLNSDGILQLNSRTARKYVGTTKFIRRDFVGNIRYPLDRRKAEDTVFTLKLLDKKPTMKFSGLVVTHYNHPRKGSLSSKN